LERLGVAGHDRSQAEAGAHEFEREPDMGDASATSEKALRLAVSAELRAKLEEVDHALEKIGLGTYGRCDGCGQDIPRERLEILPEAGLCVVCKSKIR